MTRVFNYIREEVVRSIVSIVVFGVLSYVILSVGGVPGVGLGTAAGELKISIGPNGEPVFELASGFEVPTRIGDITFSAEKDILGNEIINRLIITLDGLTKHYNLHGQNFTLDFRDDAYRFTLSASDGDFYVTADRILPNAERSNTPRPQNTAVPSTPTSQPRNKSECNRYLPSRLAINEWGRVTRFPNERSNVRRQPNVESRIKGQVAPGSAFLVIDGPECGDGLSWWYIRTDTIEGWVAEGDDSTYYLEPY